MKKTFNFLAISWVVVVIFLAFMSCGDFQLFHPTSSGYDMAGNPKCYEIIESYHHFTTDSQWDAISSHYISEDGDPSSYGYILVDGFNNNEFSVDVYKDRHGTYIYEWSPVSGDETLRYLDKKQSSWIIKQNRMTLEGEVDINNRINNIVHFEYLDEKHIKAKAQDYIWLTTGRDTILLEPDESVLLRIPDDEFDVSVGVRDSIDLLFVF